VALAATLTFAAAYESVHLLVFSDNDIWWRLRTGLWILQNHALPRTGLFSQAASRAWVDASWAFDLLVGVAYRLFGLAGLPVFLMLLQVAVAVSLFLLAREAAKRFWPAVLLAAVAQFSLWPLQPRPALCSVVFLAIEWAVLLHARRAGDERALYWLPFLFVLWTNLDRQFLYGLLSLGIFCGAVCIEQLCARSGLAGFEASNHLRLGRVGAVGAASLLASLVSPYGWRLPSLMWQTTGNSPADRFFRELHSMRFRQPQDYVLMLLVMMAFFALGRRRSRDLFLILMLAVSAVISFRFMRDNWLVVVVAVAIVGSAVHVGGESEQVSDSRLENISTAALVLIVLLTVVLRLPGKNNVHGGEELLSKIEASFPLRAADHIRENHLPQPLFNSYAWGGFLTFALAEYPVSIDGRVDLYGDDLYTTYFKLTQAEVPLDSDARFARAQTILLEANSPMAQALSTLPGFKVAYRDDQAVVLVRTTP